MSSSSRSVTATRARVLTACSRQSATPEAPKAESPARDSVVGGNAVAAAEDVATVAGPNAIGFFPPRSPYTDSQSMHP